MNPASSLAEGSLRLIFSILAGVVLLAGAIFLFAPAFLSTDQVRDQLLAQVESATGYRLRVGGPVKFSLFPSLYLVAQDVGVAPSGSADAEIATAKELRFGLVWSALWGGKVQLTEVKLADPVIAVPEKMAQNQAVPHETGGGAAVTREAAPAGAGRSAASALQRLSLDRLVIQNGTVILPPSGDTPGKRIEGLMLEAALPGFDRPLSFDIKAVYDRKPVHATGSVGNFGAFLGGTPAPIEIALDIPDHHRDKITLSGTAIYKDDAFSLKQFTAKTAGAVLAGDASYKGSILTLHPFSATVFGNSLSGALAADLSGKIPAMNVALSAETLDLNKLLSRSGDRRASGGGEGGNVGKSLADVGAVIRLAQSSSSGAGATAGSQWSDAKIDFSPLRSVNAKLKLTAKQLIYDKIKMNPGTLDAVLSGGKLNAELPSLALYNGSGAASLAVDASGQTPAQRIKLSLAGLDALPFLSDAAGFQHIEGTGTIALDLAASGASQRAMVSALGGNAKFDFANGAIRGINVAETVQRLTTGTLSGWQDAATKKTDFTELGASFQVASGQAQTGDLRLVGPLVRMAGTGSVNLPARSLQLRVDPKIMTAPQGEDGQADAQGLGVPVVIAGPWASPRIYPDIQGILENPVAAYEQLNRLGGGLIKLPGVEKLDAAAGVPGLSNVIKDGKIDKEALQQGAIDSLGQLLGKQKPGRQQPAQDTVVAPSAAPAPEPAPGAEPAYQAPPPPSPEQQPAAAAGETEEWVDQDQATTPAAAPEAPPPKKKKKQKIDTEEAKQILQDLFGN